MKNVIVFLIVVLSGSFISGCSTANTNSGSSWHSVVVQPNIHNPPIRFYHKINPIWWFGNIDEPVAPDWYRPNKSFRNTMWYFRNPIENFSNYVIGCADKETVRSGWYPLFIGNQNGGWNFAVSRRRLIYFPFIDYKRNRFEFYFGWREHANFGIKLNFRQALPKKQVDSGSESESDTK